MPSPSSSDKRFLELHGNLWRVVVAVPKKLHAKLGTTKLKRPLGTDSLREANRLKWDKVAELKAIIERASEDGSTGDGLKKRLLNEAVALRRQRNSTLVAKDREELNEEISYRAEQIAGRPIDEDEYGYPAYAPGKEALALEFARVARGEQTPIDEHHAFFMSNSGVKARTRADDERAMATLKEWLAQESIPAYLQAVTKREAVRFCDALPTLKKGLTPTTLNKYVSRLSVYWAWLENRHEVESNIWKGRRLKERPKTTDEKERPFTDEEVKALLQGNATPEMHDVMRIGALTGARLDAIVCLRVKDCEGGTFTFKPQKKEPGPRDCPIHSALKEIVERRTAGKSPDDPVFPEWPGPKNPKSLRERSFKTSNEFTAYRRSVGVEDDIEGRRRGLINFHSFRRWFITKAEQAGQPESTIATVVGHKRTGMTFGVYSGGPLLEQARQCVEAVKLPF
ncbi:DUF6538 domain-containing protein [Rhizobium grahamii]|uniref:Integrase n=1 Tax=Rhizobium grahamii TaxID=1120045 RepID=A0A370KX65_9HYPH|nr:DUF6538 domain-containing protein [Rhizobium grahamii]RDJ17042.1 integrase [Rhizobium grahamii]